MDTRTVIKPTKKTSKEKGDASVPLLQDYQQDELLLPPSQLFEQQPPQDFTIKNDIEVKELRPQTISTPEKKLTLADIIIKPTITGKTSQEIANKVVAEFNKPNNPEVKIIRTNPWFQKGSRIEPSQYYLAAYNNVPALALGGNGKRLAPKIPFFYNTSEHLGTYSFGRGCFGAHGRFVLTVPPGFFAKAFLGQEILYDAGVYVIHDPSFIFNQDGFVSQNTTYIKHGNIHILYVLPATIAKITLENVPGLLPFSPEPYVFLTFKFEYHGAVSQNAFYIQHGPLHRLSIPEGFMAKGWYGSKPVLLQSKSTSPKDQEDKPEILEINHPEFRLEIPDGGQAFPFVKASENIIQQGPRITRIITPPESPCYY